MSIINTGVYQVYISKFLLQKNKAVKKTTFFRFYYKKIILEYIHNHHIYFYISPENYYNQ